MTIVPTQVLDPPPSHPCPLFPCSLPERGGRRHLGRDISLPLLLKGKGRAKGSRWKDPPGDVCEGFTLVLGHLRARVSTYYY